MNKLTYAQQETVTENLPLVHYIIQRYFKIKPFHSVYDDYYQEGCLALCVAVLKFDESLGIKLSTFASKYIYVTCLRYRNANAFSVRSPHLERIRAKISQLEKEIPGISLKEAFDYLKLTGYNDYYAIQSPVSLNYYIEDSDGAEVEMIDKIKDTSISTEEDTINQLNEEYLYNMVDSTIDNIIFSPSDSSNTLTKNLLKDYLYQYLIEDTRPKQKDLAMKYHTTPANVSLLLKTGSAKLRKELSRKEL